MNYVSRRPRRIGLFRLNPIRLGLCFRPQLEGLDERVVPATPVIQNVVGTSHLQINDDIGPQSLDGDATPQVLDDGLMSAQTQGIFAEADVGSAASDSGATSSATCSGTFDFYVAPDAGDTIGAPVLYALNPIFDLQGNSSASYSLNGRTDPGYLLTTIGATTTFSYSCSASNSASSSITQASADVRFGPFDDFEPPVITNVPDLSTTVGQPMEMQVPDINYYWVGPTWTVSFDFNGDGKYDYSYTPNANQNIFDPPPLPWSTLAALGMQPSSVPYTYGVKVSEDLGYYGQDYAGMTWSATSTGNLTINPSPMTVTAADNMSTDGTTFGPYLLGVNFNETFTISLSKSLASPKIMGYTTDGGRSLHAASPTKDPYVWTATLNVGQFKAGMQPIEFGAVDKNFNLIASFSGNLDLTMKPDFNLEVAPAGNPAALIGAKDARFVHGPTAAVQFVGSFTNVPSYYDSMLSVNFGGKTYTGAGGSPGGTTATASFGLNAGNLNVGLDQATAKIGNWNLKPSDPTSVNVHVINEPTWLKKGIWQFDSVAGDYIVNNAILPLAPPAKKPQGGQVGWLNSLLSNLTSSNELDAIMNLNAPMNATSAVDWSDSKLHAKAIVLGNTILDQTYATGNLAVGGTIDSWSLNPSNLSMKFASPLDLGTQTLLNKQAAWALSANTKYGHLNIGLSVGLLVQGDVVANAGVLLNTVGNNVQWGPNGTFFSLTSNATANLSLQVGVSAPGGWLTGITSSGSMNLNLGIGGTVNYSGTAGNNPSIASSNFAATLDGSYDYELHGTIVKLGTEFDFYSITDDPKDGPIPKLTLFKF
jgi:hypothetical protein